VAFIDIGHAKTTITLIKFLKDEQGWIRPQILKHFTDKNLGGRDIDWKIVRTLAWAFKDEYKLNESVIDRTKCDKQSIRIF